MCPACASGTRNGVGRGWRTGTTVVLLPDGTVGGVDVRGGGPGTRETDLLHPTATMHTVHAICLTGGSAYGLAAAGGVMAHLAGARRRVPGRRRARTTSCRSCPPPSSSTSAAAARSGIGPTTRSAPGRCAPPGRRPRANGAVGAGTGAVVARAAGRRGTARHVLSNGVVVAALAVVNSAGSVIDPATGLPWMPGDVRLRRPSAADRSALRRPHGCGRAHR